MQRPLIVALAVLVLTSLGAFAYVTLRPAPVSTPTATSTTPTSSPQAIATTTTSEQPPVTVAPIVEHPAPTATTSGFKTYRNEEWGFAFEYPEGWNVLENVSRGYYTQFHLVLHPKEGTYQTWPILIHIVLPEFTENSFKSLEKATKDIVIDGVAGVKYVYTWKSDTETAIILPLGKYSMILGSKDRYTEQFDQFLKSFRFLR